MEDAYFFISLIALFLLGFGIWTLSSINRKLGILLRITLKNNDIQFNNPDLNEEIERYKDK